VTLSETPASGSYFLGWGGACTGTDTTCSVSIDGAKWVEASFRQLPSITIAKAGAGTGTVTSKPEGIDCGSDCQEYYLPGTVVTLTAAAAVGSDFAGWGGNSNACSGTDPVCTVTAVYAHFFVASFAIQQYALGVSTAGPGTGTVVSSPAGINCGADCAEDYNYGTIVNLTATAGPGSSFDSWSGSCSGSANPCVVTIDAAKSVTATFRTIPPTSSGGGSGGGSFGAFWLALGSALLLLRRWVPSVGY
jgi:hypothetical protein